MPLFQVVNYFLLLIVLCFINIPDSKKGGKQRRKLNFILLLLVLSESKSCHWQLIEHRSSSLLMQRWGIHVLVVLRVCYQLPFGRPPAYRYSESDPCLPFLQ